MSKTQTLEHKEGYEKNKLGWTPEGWTVMSLGKIGEFSKGKGVAKKDIQENDVEGLPSIRYAEIYTLYDYYTYSLETKINEESARNSNPINYGDILFAGSGETLEDIGKSVAYLGNETAYAGGDIIILKQNCQDSQYLGYLLNNDVVRNQLFKLGQGHSVVHIYSSGLKKVLIPLPPLPEQQKIAQILVTWDKAIALQEQLIAEKQALKKGLMQRLLTGKKRFPGFEEEWEVVKLEDVCDFKNGKGHEKSIDPTGQYVVVNSKFISTDGSVRKYTKKQASPLFKNNIVMVMSDVPNGKALAKCYLIDEDNRYSLNQRICSLTSININTKFLYYQLNRNKFYLKFNDGLSQTNLKKKEVLGCPIVVPQMEEQEKIVSVIEASGESLKLMQEAVKDMIQQKQGLMQQLLTGEKRVKI
ncbi:MAG: restriction endonuclease subunit S [Leeuwenhoekiella sp.]|uniref:restriction endonuclease subunit S n=1 Tax=Leeuwenhoekiella TaxID=283735 RepID=UPI000C444241|nr:restriction endonuclease subunit S [Leeuwenhoekiella blandensis]MBQ52844.1 hypothetical protein [Leeuwenhoekiella sp.]HCW63298.1 hypothetical protein [Leeuwenhoekiella sp.]|tara:strand:+ start:6088 stop:7332 length:1245 start_codon:yes stop_codon:yes gene_type:complete